MHNANIPDHAELPTTSKLIKSTIIAIIAAAIILITLVLPAEYGIDPTGVGKLTGLQRMGEIKTLLAKEAAADQEATLAALQTGDQLAGGQLAGGQQAKEQPIIAPSTDIQTHEMAVTLDPNASTEIKITMSKGTVVDFTWATSSGRAFYDLHGDSPEVDYHIYEKGTDSAKQGVLEAAFDGNHGWYWKNRTESTITITLNTTGAYQAIKEMN